MLVADLADETQHSAGCVAPRVSPANTAQTRQGGVRLEESWVQQVLRCHVGLDVPSCSSQAVSV